MKENNSNSVLEIVIIIFTFLLIVLTTTLFGHDKSANIILWLIIGIEILVIIVSIVFLYFGLKPIKNKRKNRFEKDGMIENASKNMTDEEFSKYENLLKENAIEAMTYITKFIDKYPK